jgi:hypothetical protein
VGTGNAILLAHEKWYMDTNVNEILDQVRRGESDELELKKNLKNAEEIARLISSMANTKGGMIIVGFDDDGELTGLSDSQLGITSVRIHNIASSLLPEPVRMRPAVIDGLNVLVVDVPQAPDHVKPLRTASGQVFVREGSVTRQIGTSSISVPPHDRSMSLFVAMSFRFEEEPALVDYFEAIRRAAVMSGVPIAIDRMDLVEGDYEISSEVKNRIRKSDALLADFTLNSSNVYFEAGIARGAGKYIIRTARKETELPFDIKTWRTILYANATQLEAQLVDSLRMAYEETTGYK